MRTHRGSGLWIAGRIGILICFVVMPMIRIHHRVRYRVQNAPVNDAFDKCFAAYDEAKKYPALSEGFRTNQELGNYWLGIASSNMDRIYGTNRNK